MLEVVDEIADDARPRPGTRAEELRLALQDMILGGHLQPGARLDEGELATKFGMSRTPVREAMKALIATGLLEMRGRQGVTVATISIPVLLEMFEMMAALEGLCAKLAARRATDAQKRALRETHERLIAVLGTGDPARFYAINREFHEVLYDSAQTHFLAAQTRALRSRVDIYRRRVTFQTGRMAATIGEHLQILEAIEVGDAEAAQRATIEHVNLLGDDVADLIAALPLPPSRAS